MPSFYLLKEWTWTRTGRQIISTKKEKRKVGLCERPMKQRDRNILENMHVERLRCDGPVTVGTTGLWLTRIPGQPEESPEGRGAGRGSKDPDGTKAPPAKSSDQPRRALHLPEERGSVYKKGIKLIPTAMTEWVVTRGTQEGTAEEKQSFPLELGRDQEGEVGA